MGESKFRHKSPNQTHANDQNNLDAIRLRGISVNSLDHGVCDQARSITQDRGAGRQKYFYTDEPRR
ncbi:hypothetical protein BVI2075_70097 [Burkholderia vietnamiensis]|nr:hypothetical protein BVI2075_70097 [Burkholderia vietnamiensis]